MKLGSGAAFILSYLPWPRQPLLPVSNADVAENLRSLELGKLALTLGSGAALGLISSQKFPAAGLAYLAVVGLMGGCAAVWNGVLFGCISLQVVGMSLIFFCFYGLVASFLPAKFAWACWLAAALYLIPFLCLAINQPPPPPPPPPPPAEVIQLNI